MRLAFAPALLALAVLSAFASPARADRGMLGWTDREVTEALDAFVPRLMEEYEVPGAQVAFVRKGRLLYTRGFGIENAWGSAPVTETSIFEGASLSKPLAAYTALKLVEGGILSLDRNVGLGLDPPWIDTPAGENPIKITLRQLLSHQAGFSNNLRRQSHFPDTQPGDHFAYSGEGYEYVGYALEAYEQRPFATVAAGRALKPLGMTHSGFTLPPQLAGDIVNGHVPLWRSVAVFFVPMFAIALIGIGIAFVVVRVFMHEPHMRPEHTVIPLVVGAIAAAFIVLQVVGFGLVLTALLVPLVYALAVSLSVVLWRFLFALFGLTRQPEGTVARRDGSERFWRRATLVLGIACTLPLLPLNVPLPPRGADVSHPANSLRTTAADMARFAIEVMAPRNMAPETMSLMTTPAVDAGGEYSWTLGLGVRDRPDAEGTQRTLWQWGSNPGFENLMVISPADRTALVVLTNSQNGAEMVQMLGAHVFGGLGDIEEGGGWRLPLSSIGAFW